MAYSILSPRSEESALIQLVSCFQCADIYDSPKFLSCGDIFCLQCIGSLTGKDGSVICPKCKSETKLGPEGPNGLTTCKDIEKIAAFYRNSSDKQHSPVRKEDDDTCMHLLFDRKRALCCPHCEKKFCNSCKVVHMEKLKLEAVNMGNNFQQRNEKAIATMHSKMPEMVTKFQNRMLQSIEEIQSELRRVREELCAIVDLQEKKIIDDINNKVVEKVANLQEVAAQAKNDANIGPTIEALMAKSVLYYSLEELGKIHGDLKKKSDQVNIIENVEEQYFNQEIKLDKLEELRKALTDSMTAWSESCLVWREVVPSEAEAVASVQIDMHKAVRAGDLESLKQVFERRKWSPEGINMLCRHKDESNGKRTIIHQAVEVGNVEMLKYLLETKAGKIEDIEDVESPLQIATVKNNFAVVEYLASPAVETKVSHASAALRIAIAKGYRQIADCILGNQRLKDQLMRIKAAGGKSFLHYAAEIGQREMVTLLVNRGASMSEVDANGNTALHLAAREGFTDIVSYLLYLKGDLMHVKNKSGATPSDLAVENNKTDVFDIFIEQNGVLNSGMDDIDIDGV